MENVLIPYTEEENKNMILDAGFSHCETLFKWVNFATFIAIKNKKEKNVRSWTNSTEILRTKPR